MITIGTTRYAGNSINQNDARKFFHCYTEETRLLVIRIKNRLAGRNVSGPNMNLIIDELLDWLCLPAKADPSKGTFEGLGVYEKYFRDEEELVTALIAHKMATPQRIKEEALAFSVLNDFYLFETQIDLAMQKMLTDLANNKQNISSWKYYYGPASVLPIHNDWQVIMQHLNNLTNLERLYKKIAFFHDFARNTKFNQPSDEERKAYNAKRAEHEGMRFSNAKHSLDESNQLVASDRQQGQSVWAGTSGSAMDMINIAMRYGIRSDSEITSFAWAIFAFFHFMPTIKSPTHTFIEVMRGAEKMLNGRRLIDISTDSAKRPAVHFHDMDLS